MIREFNEHDREDILRILSHGIDILYDNDKQFWFEKGHKILVYEIQPREIVACCSFGSWENEYENHGLLFLYVDKRFRKQGIGTQLYQEIMPYIERQKLSVLEVAFRVDQDDSTCFFTNLGYEKWFGMHVMKYQGEKLPQPPDGVQIVPYKDCFCEAYVDAIRKGFYDMRHALDFKPYYWMECNEEKRKELRENKDNIFVLLDNGKFAASGSVNSDDVDMLGPIIVDPAYQGKGYGKIITQYVTNIALQRGMFPVTLDVVEWNERAVNLYKSVGFEIIQTVFSYRKFFPES